jgi:hypothetical protein
MPAFTWPQVAVVAIVTVGVCIVVYCLSKWG